MNKEKVLAILEKDPGEFQKKEKTFRYVMVFLCLPLCLKSFLLYIAVIFFLFNYPFYQLKRKAMLKMTQIQYDFSIWLYQMNCYLQHHTVVNAIRKSTESAPYALRYDLQILSKKLQENPHDLQIYQGFLSDYELLLVEESMRLFHRFNFLDQQQIETLMTPLFHRSQEELLRKRQKRYDERFEKRKWMYVLPIFLLVYVFVHMMRLVMSQLFERGWMI